MPELPEVEVARASIAPYVANNTIARAVSYSTNLRWSIPPDLSTVLPGKIIQAVERRGKYLLLRCQAGSLLIHLGMTGYLRVVLSITPPEKHDHFDLIFCNGTILRLNDVRRFGSIYWAETDTHKHQHLEVLGIEPLTTSFDGNYLFQKSRGRKITVKQFIMDHKVVAGLGNIYANEALFHAGIRPAIPAAQLSKTQSQRLVSAIKFVLTTSIEVGGTMLDFRDGTERLGGFHEKLAVYRRDGQPCIFCSTPIQRQRIGKRSDYYCKICQR